MYLRKLIFGYKQMYKEGNQIVFKRYPSLLERIFGRKTVPIEESKSVEERLENVQKKLLTSIMENPKIRNRFDSFLESNIENTVSRIPDSVKRRIVNSGLEEKVLNSILENLINAFLRSLTNKILLGSAIGVGTVTPASANNYTDNQIISLLNDSTIVDLATDCIDASFGIDQIGDIDISGIDLTDDIIPGDFLLDSAVTDPDLYSFADDFSDDLINAFNSIDYSDFIDSTPDIDGLDDLVGGISDFLSSLFS